jgi:hypothetical protein
VRTATTRPRCSRLHEGKWTCSQRRKNTGDGRRQGEAFSINVDGAEVKPGATFYLLGVTFDRTITVKPYINSLARESRFRAGRVARLAQHLPRGQLLRQLRSGLLMGKIAHCLPVVVRPRLPGSTAATPEALSQVQVAVNDVARSVVGCRREDHVAIVDLLEAAKCLSLNQLAVKATAMSGRQQHPEPGRGGHVQRG